MPSLLLFFENVASTSFWLSPIISEMLCCRVACSWCLRAIKFAGLLIPPLALVLTGSLLLFCFSDLKAVHASFQHSARASASALYSLAALGVFLTTDEHLKGWDNQLPLTCPCPFLSLGSSHLFGLSSQVYFLNLVKGMPSSRSWISVSTTLTHQVLVSE